MPNISNSGNVIATGTITGTGAAIQVVCGFTPSEIQIINITHEVILQYNEEMAADHGYKTLGTGAGTISAVSAGTPAGTNASSALTVTTTIGIGQALTQPANGTNQGGATATNVFTITSGTPWTTHGLAGMFYADGNNASGLLILDNTSTTITVLGTLGTHAGVTANIWQQLPATGGIAAAQVFTGAALSTHTHTFTGSASENAYITTGGITLNANGFTIGTDADLNQIGDSLIIAAWRK